RPRAGRRGRVPRGAPARRPSARAGVLGDHRARPAAPPAPRTGRPVIAPATARRVWETLEPLHASVYFAPEPAEAFAKLGLKGFWMGYVASRAAPMGPVGPAVVEATFAGFHPSLIRRALPDAWDLATPEEIIATRFTAASQAL